MTSIFIASRYDAIMYSTVTAVEEKKNIVRE